LHPQYVDLTALPTLKDAKARERFEKTRKELNALPQIDYERVNFSKIEYLHLLFEQEGEKVLKSNAFKTFFKETEHWLVPYAQYSYLRDKYGTADQTITNGMKLLVRLYLTQRTKHTRTLHSSIMYNLF